MYNTGNLAELQKSLNDEENFFNRQIQKPSATMSADITSGLTSTENIVEKK